MEIEMLNQKQNNANGGISPLTIPKLALNTRFSDQVASPVEFRSKIQDRSLTNIINNSLAVNLPTAAQLFPQRRRSSAISGSANLMAGRAYKLVPEIGKKGRRESRFRQQPAKRSSSQQELQRGHGDNLLVSQKLDWIDLQMRSSEYLKNLRGFPRLSITTEEPLHMGRPQLGHKKRSTLVVDEGTGEAAVSFNRSTNMTNRLTFKRQVREGSVSRSSFTKPLVSTTATEERKRRGTAVEDRRAHQGSVVEVPLDPKHWLLQSLRLQDYELQELFDQMEDVTEMIPYDTAGVRNQLKELDGRKSEMPPDVKMLRKDQTLLDKVKNLITRYIEVQGKKRQDVEPPEADDEFREKTPALFEGFERNQEGNLLPVFTKGTSLCSLCGQARTKKLTRDSELSASPLLEPQSLMHALPSFIPIEDYVIYQSIVQPVGHEKEYKSAFSPHEKRWHIVLFPALQPGKREDVILLGEWLQHSVLDKKCHDTDGHIADIEVSFQLHSISFLEIVRQVSLECKERGDMLLHLWRQVIRIFNQVMASTEPKLTSLSAELVRSREIMALSKDKLSDLTGDLKACTLKFKTVSEALKQKNLQFVRLQRCRLCLAENLSPRAREKFVRRATMKHFASSGGSMIPQEETKSVGEIFQESLASHQAAASSVEGGQAEGGGNSVPSEPVVVEGGKEEVGIKESAAASTEGIVNDSNEQGAAPGRAEEQATVAASPGDIITISPTFRIFKRVSEGFTHDDGIHADVPAQTIDPAKKHPFFEVLDRPKTAPPRLNTYGMEIFEPLSAADAAVWRKLKREKRLKREKEMKKTGRIVGDVAPGGLNESDASIKDLAAETMQLLEQVGMNPKLANRFKGILSKLRRLKDGILTADGWLNEIEPDSEDASFLEAMGLDGGKGKGKKGQLGKMRKGGDSRRGSQFINVAEELMARGRGSSEIKSMKAKDLPFLPLGFAKMMKITPPPKVIKSFNERQLLKLVEGIYASKIQADAVDDEVNNERQSACEFVYDYMLNIYGLKGLAESAVHGVFKKIKKMMISKGIEKCHKLRLFQRFCGFDLAKGYAEPDLYMYLKLLNRGQSKLGVLYSEQDDGIVFLNCAQVDNLFDEPCLIEHFNGDRDAAAEFITKFAGLHATTEKVAPELQKILKTSQVKRVDFDLLMENVIDFNPTRVDTKTVRVKLPEKVAPQSEEEGTALENLFVAGDANQDGVLTFTEFREIISCVEPSISQQNALRMFRETLVLMPEGGDSISPKAFATVAHAHGIKAPSDTIFNLLKKTWDQIQDDVNPVKMAEEEKSREATNLREKLEELIASGTQVSEAVQTFRDFVLNFCGGKQGDEERLGEAAHESDESD